MTRQMLKCSNPEDVELVKARMYRLPPHCKPGVGPDAEGVAVYMLSDGQIIYDNRDFYMRRDDETDWTKLL